MELTTNYTSYIYITQAFLPFLLKKHSALIYSSSGLALVPLPRCPNYCATKAALHHFLLSLRIHLKGTSTAVLEIFPPAVQTELHDSEYQPGTPRKSGYQAINRPAAAVVSSGARFTNLRVLDIKNGRKIGMPLTDFVEETYQMLTEGNAYGEFPIGASKEWYASVEPGRKYGLSKMPQVPADI